MRRRGRHERPHQAGCVALVLFLSLPAPVAAGPFEDGVAAYGGDDATALRLWRPLAQQGDAEAQNNLGHGYAQGQGVPQDYGEAVRWYRRAAEQGDAVAANNLGTMYDKGRGVAKDYVHAHKWYNLAAARCLASETENRDKAVRNRDRIAVKMTAAQIAEAQRLAREWKPR